MNANSLTSNYSTSQKKGAIITAFSTNLLFAPPPPPPPPLHQPIHLPASLPPLFLFVSQCHTSYLTFLCSHFYFCDLVGCCSPIGLLYRVAQIDLLYIYNLHHVSLTLSQCDLVGKVAHVFSSHCCYRKLNPKLYVTVNRIATLFKIKEALCTIKENWHDASITA